MPELHERMHRLPSSHKKLRMLREDEPNFSEISSRRPLPEAPVITLNLSAEMSNCSSINRTTTKTQTSVDRQPAFEEITQLRP